MMNNYALKAALLFPFNVLYRIAPKTEIKLMYRLKQGRKLDLEHPDCFNAKIQWTKFYEDGKLFPVCSDKYTVREYLVKEGFSEILNELLWQGFDPEDIPFDELPNEFVIKVTHGSGFNIICRDKASLDIADTRKKLKKWLKYKFLPCYGEWWYGVEKPRVIVEKLIKTKDGTPLFDYKFFCFDGEPKYVYIDTWKNGDHFIDMCDMDLNVIPGVRMGYDCDAAGSFPKPENYGKMVEYARKLSKPFRHVRVDMYNCDGKIYFGELSFSKGAGFDRIEPYEFDVELGSHWILPECPGGKNDRKKTY